MRTNLVSLNGVQTTDFRNPVKDLSGVDTTAYRNPYDALLATLDEQEVCIFTGDSYVFGTAEG